MQGVVEIHGFAPAVSISAPRRRADNQPVPARNHRDLGVKVKMGAPSKFGFADIRAGSEERRVRHSYVLSLGAVFESPRRLGRQGPARKLDKTRTRWGYGIKRATQLSCSTLKGADRLRRGGQAAIATE